MKLEALPAAGGSPVFRTSQEPVRLLAELGGQNKAEIGRRTALGRQRIGELCNNTSTRLAVEELYKIALAINVDPGEMLMEICKDITLDIG